MSLRIYFERSGGLAGPATHRTYTVDSETLPAPEAEELSTLVNAADLPATGAPRSVGSPARPDAYHYRLVIDRDGRQHTVEVSDTEMPASLRPLVKWLLKRAVPGRS